MPIIGQAVISSRLEAKNLRGIYKFSFTNVTILYYFFFKISNSFFIHHLSIKSVKSASYYPSYALHAIPAPYLKLLFDSESCKLFFPFRCFHYSPH
jgi:hypothetical protein